MTFNYLAYTDGSAYHGDGLGGSAGTLINTFTKESYTFVQASTHTSVARREFEALLQALDIIMQVNGWNTAKKAETAKHAGITVQWVSDREDLVKSIEHLTTGYRRKTNPDLWSRFEYYEQFLKITAVHKPRNTIHFQALADRMAGDMREFLKKYALKKSAFNLRCKI